MKGDSWSIRKFAGKTKEKRDARKTSISTCPNMSSAAIGDVHLLTVETG